MTDVTTKLNITRGDTSGVAALDNANKLTAEAIKKTEGWNDALIRSQKSFKMSSELARTALNKVKLQTEKLNTEIKAYGEEAERAFKKQEDAAKRASRASADAVPSAGGFGKDAAGDLSTSLGSFASVGGALGGGLGSEITALGGDIFGVVEYLGRFRESLGALGQAAINNSSAFGGLLGSLGNVGAGLATLGVGAVAAAALAVAMDGLNKVLAEGTEIGTRYAEANRKVATEIAAGLTTADAQKRIEELNAIIEGETNAITANQQYLDAAAQKLNQDLGIFGGLANAVSNADDAVIGTIEGSQDAIKDARAELARLTAALDSGQLAANDLKEAETELTTERDQHRAAVEALTEQEADLRAAYAERQRQQQEDLDLQKRQLAEREALDAEFADARAELDAQFASEDAARDATDRQAALQDKLAQITQDGNARIVDLYQQLSDKTADAQKRISELQADYATDSAKAQAEFEREALRRQREFNDRRRDIEQSYEDATLEGLLSNDVGSILRAQRDRTRGLEEVNRDESRASSDASEEFAREQAERKAALDARILDIQTELAEFQKSQAAKIEIERANIQTRLADEQAAFEASEALRIEQDTRAREREAAYTALEEELTRRKEALTLAQDAERRAITEARELASLNAQLAKIDAKRDAELAALDAVISRASSVATGTSSSSTSAYNTPRTFDPSKYGTTGSQGYGFGLQPFATGGIVTRPTAALIGEREPEAVIPLSRMGDMSGGGRPVTINMAGAFSGAAFGEVATQRDLDDIAVAVEGALTQTLVQFLRATE